MELVSLYDIQEELGRGTYGVVRKCVEKKSRKIVAIKEIELDREDEEKTANEVRICRKLQHHDRIVKLEDVIYCELYVYLVFEYLNGGDLFDSILQRNWYSEKKACGFARQILEAIQYCHKMRVVHRDLKPENLLVCQGRNGEVPQLKLIDFGIAREMPDERDYISCDMTGSPLYMAPERILERPSGCGVDIWSCGVILFVLMAGYPPFWSDDIEELFLLIVQGNYSFHSPYWSKVSSDVKDLIKQMLEVDPISRISATDALNHVWFQTAMELLSDNQEKTLRTLEAFNSRRKLKSVALVLIARKRFSSNVSKKLNKERKRRTSTTYVPDKELESYSIAPSWRQKRDHQGIPDDATSNPGSLLEAPPSPVYEVPEDVPVECETQNVLRVTIKVLDH